MPETPGLRTHFATHRSARPSTILTTAPGRGPGSVWPRTRPWVPALTMLLLVCIPLSSGGAKAGGFSVDGQSAQAAGLGGALAAVPDPSSLYVNPGAAAFFQKPSLAAGSTGRVSGDTTFISGTSDFGSPLSSSLSGGTNLLAHAYSVTPLRANINLGVALYSPFDLDSSWASPDGFVGRTLSTQARIQTLDANTSLTFRLADSLGIGIGVVVRTSEIEHARRIQTTDPDTSAAVDFASFGLQSDMEIGLGWNLGIYHRPLSWLAWGLSYRSAIEIDYGGSGILTQIATGNDQLDAVLAAGNPFDLEVPFTTTVEFPEVGRVGVAIGPPDRWLLLLDVEFTGWSSVQAIDFDVPDLEIYSRTFDMDFEDTVSYFLGAQYQMSSGMQWRAGYAFEPTPQPASTVGPFLYDGDRNTVSLGFGRDWLDLALQWTTLADRTVAFDVPTDGTDTSVAGTFSSETFRLTFTVKKKPPLGKKQL